MDPALKAALSQQKVLLFGAIKIELPSYTLRLLDGAGTLVIAGETYVGIDPTYGTISGISEITESLGDSAPEVTITLYPASLSSAAVLSNPLMQGSPVTIMVGAADPISGVVIGTPEVLFLGELDVPSISVNETGARDLEYTVVSVFERLFEVEEGQRAQTAWQQSIWPGELGLDYMTGTDVNLYWGAKPPQGRSMKQYWTPY